MALVQIAHSARSVGVNQPLWLIVPDPAELAERPLSERPVLYLLHGLSDDASAWERYTSIEMVARQYGLVVVMPTAGRSFYADMRNGQAYFTYVTEELPRYLTELFNLRPPRERTLVAGNSMGGYGALKCGLLQPERYGAVCSLSGVTSLQLLESATPKCRAEFELVFGDLGALTGSQHDPAVWLADAAATPGRIPRLHACCGTEDELIGLNRQFAAQCRALGVPLQYDEEPGAHNWFYWDVAIRRFLACELGGAA